MRNSVEEATEALGQRDKIFIVDSLDDIKVNGLIKCKVSTPFGVITGYCVPDIAMCLKRNLYPGSEPVNVVITTEGV